MVERLSVMLDDVEIQFETGRIAKQAHGAVICRSGDTMVLSAVCVAPEAKPGQDFFPLMMNRATHVPAIRFFSYHVYDDKSERRKKIERNVLDLISVGKIVPKFHGVLPLSEVRKAHEMLDAGAIIGKLIMTP